MPLLNTRKGFTSVLSVVLVLVLVGVGIFVFKNYFEKMTRVTDVKTASGVKPSDSNGGNTESEQDEIMAVAKGNSTENKINGIAVEYQFGKQVENYATVRAVPLHNETDPLVIVLQNIDGKWEVIEFGTAFPVLEQKVPTLFE